ncbi:MAG: hypothetical protein AB7S72_20180, partial [Draconibacterium sp.]
MNVAFAAVPVVMPIIIRIIQDRIYFTGVIPAVIQFFTTKYGQKKRALKKRSLICHYDRIRFRFSTRIQLSVPDSAPQAAFAR